MDERTHRISLRAYEIWEKRGRPHGDDLENWLEAEREVNAELGASPSGNGADEGANEGEGSRSAARAYNAGLQQFERTGQVERKAREAAQAVDGPEGEELRRAEEEGRRRSRGEDPLLH